MCEFYLHCWRIARGPLDYRWWDIEDNVGHFDNMGEAQIYMGGYGYHYGPQDNTARKIISTWSE